MRQLGMAPPVVRRAGGMRRQSRRCAEDLRPPAHRRLLRREPVPGAHPRGGARHFRSSIGSTMKTGTCYRGLLARRTGAEGTRRGRCLDGVSKAFKCGRD